MSPEVTYQAHELAVMLPQMSPEEFDGLKQSIAVNGLLQPIVIHEDKILDGLHRYRACRELEIEPRTTTLPEGIDPTDFVIATNLNRRHLPSKVRAAIGAKLLEVKLARQEQIGGQQASDLSRDEQKANLPSEEQTRDRIAKALGISGRSVQNALKVKREDLETFHQLEHGKISVHAAVKKVKGRLKPAEESTTSGTEFKRSTVVAKPPPRTTGGCIAKPVLKRPLPVGKSLPPAERNEVADEACEQSNAESERSTSADELLPQTVLVCKDRKEVSPERLKVPNLIVIETAHIRAFVELMWPEAIKVSPGLKERDGWQC